MYSIKYIFLKSSADLLNCITEHESSSSIFSWLFLKIQTLVKISQMCNFFKWKRTFLLKWLIEETHFAERNDTFHRAAIFALCPFKREKWQNRKNKNIINGSAESHVCATYKKYWRCCTFLPKFESKEQCEGRRFISKKAIRSHLSIIHPMPLSDWTAKISAIHFKLNHTNQTVFSEEQLERMQFC